MRAHARGLEREGWRTVVVAPRTGGAFGWPGVAARLRERPLRVLGAARWIAAAHAHVGRLDVARVVAHWCVPCAWPIAVAASSRARLDVVSHGGDVRLLAALPRAAARWIVARIAARASTWTFPSDATKADLLALLDPPRAAAVERIADVRAPLIEMPDVASAITSRRRELGGARVAACVGRLVATKRVDRVIDAMARSRSPGETAATARSSFEADMLVVVGDGPERRRLERLATLRGVDARFVGDVPRTDALAWIGAAAVVLHASEAEGLSTVVREAEALGTRVVRIDGA